MRLICAPLKKTARHDICLFLCTHPPHVKHTKKYNAAFKVKTIEQAVKEGTRHKLDINEWTAISWSPSGMNIVSGKKKTKKGFFLKT